MWQLPEAAQKTRLLLKWEIISSISSAPGSKELIVTLPLVPFQEPQEACWWKCRLCSYSTSNKWQVLTHFHLWCRKADRFTYAFLCSNRIVYFGDKKPLRVQGLPCSCFLLFPPPSNPRGKWPVVKEYKQGHYPVNSPPIIVKFLKI